MASSNSDLLPPSLEDLSTRGVTSLLLPWILRIAPSTASTPFEVAIFVHQSTRSLTLVEGSLNIESLLREIPSKKGHLPATKASIESLPRVRVSEPGLECTICLSEYEDNGEAEVKEMPCKHQFHPVCIDKWLGIHGSCPICRFSMPVEEEKQGDEVGGWRIHVLYSRGIRGRVMDMDTGGNDGHDEHPSQDMDID